MFGQHISELGSVESLKDTSIEADEVFSDAEKYDAAKDNLEFPLRRRGFFLLGAVVMVVFVAALSRLAYLSFYEQGHYAALAVQAHTAVDWSAAGRGLILDRFGKPLVRNEATASLVAIPAMLPKNQPDLFGLAQQVAGYINESPDTVMKIFVRAGTISNKPVVIAPNLDEARALFLGRVFDNNQTIQVAATSRRLYLKGPAFSHVLGYTGKVSAQEIANNKANYLPIDNVGRAGLEAQYESILRGQHGETDYLISATGKRLKKISSTDSTPGSTIVTTIDSEFQSELATDLGNELQKINRTAAAAVAIDPRNGDVLALVSFPHYDDNIFSKGLNPKEYASLLNDSNKPLFDRATSGQYPPGSSIKPVVGSGVMAEHIIDPQSKIFVTGSISVPSVYDPSVKYVFKDWRPQGWVDFERAIAVSSNVYFYTVGGGYGDIKGLGPERLAHYFKLFGLGAKLGIDLPAESPGFIPTPAWKEASQGEQWFIGDTYHISIGQGNLMVTPLQVVSYTATIANGGTLYRPHLLKAIERPDGSEQPYQPDVIGNVGISEKSLSYVQAGMRLAVTDGSARQMQSVPVAVAGKTGTAQPGGGQDPHAWFTSYAPYDNPQIALTVIIENGGEGNAVSVPVARKALTWYARHRLLK